MRISVLFCAKQCKRVSISVALSFCRSIAPNSWPSWSLVSPLSILWPNCYHHRARNRRHRHLSATHSHSFGEQFSQKKWTREVAGQREILAAYGGVKLADIRGMRAPFLSVGGNKMYKMLYDSNFTYDSSMPVYENRPPSWPYTLDYKIFHDCMIPPCPTKSYPGMRRAGGQILWMYGLF